MSSVIQVNRIYLIFNPVHFLVDSSDPKYKIYELFQCAAECHLRSIVTAKGLQIMEDFKKENKEIRYGLCLKEL